MADWDRCRTDLYWSANHSQQNWHAHGDALEDYSGDDESDAFDMLWDIQDHDELVQENYRQCRDSNKTQFWSIAQGVFDSAGPHLDESDQPF